MPEYKQMPHATKEINDRTVIGIAAVHGNVDEGGDKSWPGSFADTKVDGRDRAVFLWMHDPMTPPTAAINYVREVRRADLPPSVLNYAPDATGGVEVSRTYLETPRGDEILAALKADAIREMSYAYEAKQYDFEEVDGQTIRNLRKVEIFDFSDVQWGANPATIGSKAVKGQPLHLHHATALAAVATLTSRYSDLAALRAKDGRVLSGENRTRIKAAVNALQDAVTLLDQLLVATEPKQSLDMRRLQLEYIHMLARLNGVPLP
jgi:HK97 family phage prohead protease